jgi:hypothetical protein
LGSLPWFLILLGFTGCGKLQRQHQLFAEKREEANEKKRKEVDLSLPFASSQQPLKEKLPAEIHTENETAQRRKKLMK